MLRSTQKPSWEARPGAPQPVLFTLCRNVFPSGPAGADHRDPLPCDHRTFILVSTMGSVPWRVYLPGFTMPSDPPFAGVPNKSHQAGRETPASLRHPHRHPKRRGELQKVGPLLVSQVCVATEAQGWDDPPTHGNHRGGGQCTMKTSLSHKLA